MALRALGHKRGPGIALSSGKYRMRVPVSFQTERDLHFAEVYLRAMSSMNAAAPLDGRTLGNAANLIRRAERKTKVGSEERKPIDAERFRLLVESVSDYAIHAHQGGDRLHLECRGSAL